MTRPAPVDPHAHTWLELGEVQRLLLEPLPRLALGLDLEGRVLWINPAGARSLGLAADALQGRPAIGSLLRSEDAERRARELSEELGTPVPADAGIFSAKLRQGLADEAEWTLRTPDGEPRIVRLSWGTLRRADAGVVGLMAVECSPGDAADAGLALRHHDALTGLPARALLQDRAEMAMQRAARTGTRVGLLAVELQDFEALCAEHGSTFGDDLLRATASRLHFELRKTDTAVRMPQGRFVAMLVDLREAEEARRVAEKIVTALVRPVNTGIEFLHPRCRIGVAVYPDHGDQLLPLLQVADRALQEAQADTPVVMATPQAQPQAQAAQAD